MMDGILWLAAGLGALWYVLGAAYDYILHVGEDEPAPYASTALRSVRALGAAVFFVVAGVQIRGLTGSGFWVVCASLPTALLVTAAKYGLLRWIRPRCESWRRGLALFFVVPMTAVRPLAALYDTGSRVLGFALSPRKPEHRKYDPEPAILQNLEREARQSDAVPGEILQNLAEFQNLRADDCLVPRTEIVALPLSAPVAEFRRVFRETGLSRIVVYGQTLDDVKGFVHVLGLYQRPENITDIVQPALFVAEATSAPALLDEFNRKHKSVAVVVDEFGGVAGLLTVEDVIEAVIGDVNDEYDDETETDAQKVGPNEYVFDAKLEVEDVNQNYGFDLPQSDEYDSLGGLVMHYAQRVLQPHEQLTVENYLITVVKGNFHKIETVRVKKIE